MRTAILAAGWLLCSAAAAQPAPPGQLGQPDTAAVAAAIVDATNAFRQAQGLAPTRRDPRLDAAARNFAGHMAATERYGHQADGRDPAARAAAAGGAWCLVAENIAYILDARLHEPAALAGSFVDNWIDSPGHRRNIVDADATDTGVGVATGVRSGRRYAVQMFGRPQSASLRFSISNRTGLALRYTLDGEGHDLPPRVTRSHERCRALPPLLVLRAPGQGAALRLQPADGQRWTVERDGAAGLRALPAVD